MLVRGLNAPCRFSKRKYKYTLENPIGFATGYEIAEGADYAMRLCGITRTGDVWGLPGYSWDGASGPTWDTRPTYRASLFHDIACQLLRETRFGSQLHDQRLAFADGKFRDFLIADGMWRWRADRWYRALRLTGGGYADVMKRRIYTAP